MKKLMATKNRFKEIDRLTQQTGVLKTFIAKAMDMSPQAFAYALERGLSEKEEKTLRLSLNKSANALLGFETAKLRKEN